MGLSSASFDRRQAVANYGPAVVLLGLVLLVFAVLQNYGPQSTVRRYHMAIQDRQLAALSRVLVEPVDSPPSQLLNSFVARQLQIANYRIVARDDQADGIRLLVVYSARQGRWTYPVVFFTEKSGSRWRVNASKTLTGIEGLARSTASR